MDEKYGGVKTYSAAGLAWIFAWLPHTCDEWSSVFGMIGSFLALILVIWRLQREIRKGKWRTKH